MHPEVIVIAGYVMHPEEEMLKQTFCLFCRVRRL
jgi:hypothetical protein